MKNIIPILLILLTASCKKDEFNPNQTKVFTIQSTSTGANYAIKVALPDNFDPYTQTYDAVYVLDGEANFEYVANNCKTISKEYSTSNVLVVGIGYGNDRAFDYTPSGVNHNGGGAEKFMHFIKDELVPQMEKRFAADTARKNRVILGHSFGGLLTAYAFTNFNAVFGNYLMLSPSIWYDNEIILGLERETRAHNQTTKQLVFMGLGGLESGGRMMAPFEAFFQRLKNNYPTITLSKHIEAQLEHMGSKNPNIKEGLNFYFKNR
jgi:uncharacterized protein